MRAAARSLNLPYAVQLRGDDVWVWPHRSPEATDAFALTVLDAALVMAVSRALVRGAESLAGRSIRRAAILPNGIELERFRPLQSEREGRELRALHRLPVESFIVICVGDALVRKGWTDLLAALNRVSEGSRVTLLAVVGSAAAELDIEGEAARRAPKLELRMIRAASPDVLAELYRSADAFCLATHSEGMSNAVLEAMASGLPIVTTNVGGHAEVITHKQEGFLVDLHAPGQMASSLLGLIADAESRRAMGRAARHRAERVGDPSSTGRRMAALLAGLASGNFDPTLLEVDPYAAPNLASESRIGVS